MMLNPSVQAKAQEEIDRVVGTDRLPTLADRSSLPYIDALIKETFRWNPVLPLGKCASLPAFIILTDIFHPLGFPHSVTQDDIHKDFFIPKGSIIMVNAW